jgi:DNA repair protein REV1
VSIGISWNIILSRIASRKAKPANSFLLVPEDLRSILDPLDIKDLHGFGRSTKQKAVEKLGTSTLGELMKKPKGTLCDTFGKGTGEMLYNALRGVDERKLVSDKPRKSVSCDINVRCSHRSALQEI